MSFTILIPVHFYVFFNHHAPSDRGVLGWELSPLVGATVVKTTSLSASIFVSGQKISTLRTTYVGIYTYCFAHITPSASLILAGAPLCLLYA